MVLKATARPSKTATRLVPIGRPKPTRRAERGPRVSSAPPYAVVRPKPRLKLLVGRKRKARVLDEDGPRRVPDGLVGLTVRLIKPTDGPAARPPTVRDSKGLTRASIPSPTPILVGAPTTPTRGPAPLHERPTNVGAPTRRLALAQTRPVASPTLARPLAATNARALGAITRS